MSKDLEKKFPEYFKNFKLPELAREQELKVYRACATGKVDQTSFLNSYEENGNKVIDGFDISDATAYSLSAYTEFKDIKRFMNMQSKYKVPYTIAVGITNPIYGVCLETKEWKRSLGEKCKSSHVDWWLYEGARPWEGFKEVVYDDGKPIE